jgi:hypothetical protein
LGVDVLVLWTGEDLGLGTEADNELPIVPLFDRPGSLQQRQHVVPLDVVARRVPKEPQEGVTMLAAEVLWLGA